MAELNISPDGFAAPERERWYEVTTDTMAPAFPKGCSVFIDCVLEEKPGDFVLAKLPDGTQVLRQLGEDRGERYLVVFNGFPHALPVPLGTEIVGVVRQAFVRVARGGE